jgi:hypothetical protein
VAGRASDRFWAECGASRYVDNLAGEPTGAGPTGDVGVDGELLPTRLAAACACALGAGGAGLSILDGDFRVPIGASDDTASYAERLQFTQGQGPCLDAARDGQIVVARSDEIRRRWPQFADAMFAATPYRAVLTVPLSIMSATRGALDLFLAEDASLSGLLLADAAEVSAAVVQALRRADDRGERPASFEGDVEPLPSWLAGPAAKLRRFVWLAVGMTMARFDVNADDAVAMLRAFSYGRGEVLDAVAVDLVEGRLQLDEIGN